ncbi:hypothetical protein ACROYT_G016579 [Oculina patagonica]
MHSGHDSQHIPGVAIIVSKAKANTLLEWESLSDRLIRARSSSKHCKTTILHYYVPTNDADEEDKGDWYEQLQQAVFKVPLHDMLLIMGDVGADNSDCDRAMRKHGCGVMNDNGSARQSVQDEGQGDEIELPPGITKEPLLRSKQVKLSTLLQGERCALFKRSQSDSVARTSASLSLSKTRTMIEEEMKNSVTAPGK